MPYGTLLLIIVDGRNLKDMVFSLALYLYKASSYNTLQDLVGKMDPYVTFQLAAGANVRARWRCKTHTGGGKTPSWNDRHSFDVVDGDDRIQAQCYDEDHGSSDDLIGMVSIDLNPVFDSGIRDEWFPLQVSLHLACSFCV
jgi:Ca2+-dependent lipid-binding protein